ncbi:MAG TPA: VOC family protein [Sinorhizobium sp.]|nr:VOC family protein [Sinorhizobium sp.]
MRGAELAPALEGILETALYADDLDRAEAFYGTVLGLERITRAGNRHVFFRCGDGVLLIFNPAETVKPPAAGALAVPPHGTKGSGHMCFRVAPQALDAWKAKLKAAGVAIEADIRWPNGARSFYFRDPAGNSLECAEPGLWAKD